MMQVPVVLLLMFFADHCLKSVFAMPRGFVSSLKEETKLIRTRRVLGGKGASSSSDEDGTFPGSLVCQSDESEIGALSEILVTPRSRVDSFLDADEKATKELSEFIEYIRSIFGEEEFSSTISDREILLAVMAPENENIQTLRYLQVDQCVDFSDPACAVEIVKFIEGLFNLIGNALTLTGGTGLSGPLSKITKRLGEKVGDKILASPAGRDLVNQIVQLSRNKANPFLVVEKIAFTAETIVQEIGVNQILREIAQTDISWIDALAIGSNFLGGLVCAGISGGACTALKIAQAGASTVGLVETADKIAGCAVPCPTQSPSKAPTPSPTAPPSPTPTREPTTPPPTPPPGRRSGVFGDPHLSTFDRLRFDCQGAGEFITVTSLEDPTFMIQERFTAVDSSACSQASISTGVSIRDDGLPTVQISTPRVDSPSSLNTVANCPIDIYIDGNPSVIGTDLGSDVEVSSLGNRFAIFYPSTNIQVDLTVRSSTAFGCFFLVSVFIPNAYRTGETILGLLGTPNGNRSDDWRERDGSIVTIPNTPEESIFSTAYQYCVDNWCIRDLSESIFTYGTGESFGDISGCDENYSSDIEEAVNNPSPETLAICNTDVFCLVDGYCGNLEDATNALIDEQQVVEAQEEADPLPSGAPSVSHEPSESPSARASRSLTPSESPSSLASRSLTPSGMPSAGPTSLDCIAYGTICDYKFDNIEDGPSEIFYAVCVEHETDKDGRHYHQECYSENSLSGVRLGEFIPDRPNRKLMSCGCCPKTLPDGISKVKGKTPVCDGAKDCLAEAVASQCKVSKSEPYYDVCITKSSGTSTTKCKKNFYRPKKDSEVECGACLTI